MLILNFSQIETKSVADAAGSWQFESGSVLWPLAYNTQLGFYTCVRRVILNPATSDNQNSAPVTTTISNHGNVPQGNITLQGVCRFTPEREKEPGEIGAITNEIGGVSAATAFYAGFGPPMGYLLWQYIRTGNTITIGWRIA
jgi:hypothetical protein